MKVICVSRSQFGSWVEKIGDDSFEIEKSVDACCEEIRALLEEGGAGDSITFTIEEMTQEEIDALPEFAGW